MNLDIPLTRIRIIAQLKKYFKIYELVSREVHAKYGNNAWSLFQTDALHCLLIIRKGIRRRFTVNTWYWDGPYDERGFRENTCDICKSKTKKKIIYTSGHVLGCAFDFTVNNMSPDLVREWIVENKGLFPCKVRLENEIDGIPISWVHFDTKFYEKNPKIYLFNI